MTDDVPAELKELSATLTSIEKVLDLGALRKEVADLEEQAAQPDLWTDQERAQRVTSRLSQVQATCAGSTTCAAASTTPA